MLNNEVIGTVLTCATDMGIGLLDGNVISLTTPEAPDDFSPKGLSCGFVRVKGPVQEGETLTLRDKRRELSVTIVTDVRPDRTARMPWPEA